MYIGAWVKEIRQGFGKITYHCGEYSEGSWLNGKLE